MAVSVAVVLARARISIAGATGSKTLKEDFNTFEKDISYEIYTKDIY